MAQKIRGVTVEVGGDTSGLQKSLKEVNSAISATARQLKDVNNLLKLDPGNTELLKQKQVLLANEITEVKKKKKPKKPKRVIPLEQKYTLTGIGTTSLLLIAMIIQLLMSGE